MGRAQSSATPWRPKPVQARLSALAKEWDRHLPKWFPSA